MKGESWRYPNARERELCLGFPPGYTDRCLVKDNPKQLLEDVRCSLLGNTFFVPVVGALLAQVLLRENILDLQPSLSTYWGMSSPKEEEEALQPHVKEIEPARALERKGVRTAEGRLQRSRTRSERPQPTVARCRSSFLQMDHGPFG